MGLYRPLYRVCAHHHELSGSPAHSTAQTAPAGKASHLHLQHWPLSPDGQSTLGWADALQRILGAEQPQPGPIKGAAYLAWRYGQHPRKPYRLWRVRGRWMQTVGWLVTRQDPQAVVIDALLPTAWSTGAGWAAVLGALARATGQLQWTSWRPALPAIDTPDPTLIEAGEFRYRELNGLAAGRWAAQPLPGAQGREGPPLFQPGDTDVF
jgi:hypothetical protein